MTNTEKLIAHIKMRLAHDSYTVLDWELTMLDKMLKALPSYEEDKVYDIICGEDEASEFDDDRLYRMFDSTEFHVGDEVRYGCTDNKAVVLYAGEESIAVLESDNSIPTYALKDIAWKRTGRNFPAIENILNILKKSEVNNAE